MDGLLASRRLRLVSHDSFDNFSNFSLLRRIQSLQHFIGLCGIALSGVNNCEDLMSPPIRMVHDFKVAEVFRVGAVDWSHEAVDGHDRRTGHKTKNVLANCRVHEFQSAFEVAPLDRSRCPAIHNLMNSVILISKIEGSTCDLSAILDG